MTSATSGAGELDRPPSVARPSMQALTVHRRTSGVNVGNGERVASAAAGASLLAYGLLQRGLTGAATGFAGAVLVARGATGFCPLYRSLGRDTAHGRRVERDTAMARAITIGADPDALRAFVRDPENARRILPFLESVRVEGDVWELETRLPGGRRLRWQSRCSDENGGGLMWRSLPRAPFEHELRLAFERAPGDRGTQLHAWLDVRPPGGAASAAVAHWLRGLGERGIGVALARLKQLVETGELATTGRQPEGRRSRASRLVGRLRAQEASA